MNHSLRFFQLISDAMIHERKDVDELIRALKPIESAPPSVEGVTMKVNGKLISWTRAEVAEIVDHLMLHHRPACFLKRLKYANQTRDTEDEWYKANGYQSVEVTLRVWFTPVSESSELQNAASWKIDSFDESCVETQFVSRLVKLEEVEPLIQLPSDWTQECCRESKANQNERTSVFVRVRVYVSPETLEENATLRTRFNAMLQAREQHAICSPLRSQMVPNQPKLYLNPRHIQLHATINQWNTARIVKIDDATVTYPLLRLFFSPAALVDRFTTGIDRLEPAQRCSDTMVLYFKRKTTPSRFNLVLSRKLKKTDRRTVPSVRVPDIDLLHAAGASLLFFHKERFYVYEEQVIVELDPETEFDLIDVPQLDAMDNSLAGQFTIKSLYVD